MIASVLQAICARDAAEVLKSERVVEVDGAGVIREDVKLELRKSVFPCLFNRNLDHCASKTESAVRCLNRNAKACVVLHLAVGADTLHPKVTDNRASCEGRDGEILWIFHPCLQLMGKKRASCVHSSGYRAIKDVSPEVMRRCAAREQASEGRALRRVSVRPSGRGKAVSEICMA